MTDFLYISKKEKCYTEVYEIRFCFIVFVLILVTIVIVFPKLTDCKRAEVQTATVESDFWLESWLCPH